MQFIEMYENWKPVHNGQFSVQRASGPDDIILGCSVGHPSEVSLIIIQEIARITSLLTDCKWKISVLRYVNCI